MSMNLLISPNFTEALIFHELEGKLMNINECTVFIGDFQIDWRWLMNSEFSDRFRFILGTIIIRFNGRQISLN